jgi:nitroreductase/NAD-dependent dihydropyrimidine dehydrogenase PreA subunit
MSLITIDENLCKRDGICASECPSGTIFVKEKGSVPIVSRKAEEFCVRCGHCVAVCPQGAITMDMMKPQDCVPVLEDGLPNADQTRLLLTSRRSIRTFKEEPVSRDMLEKLIDTVRYAPSQGNAQPVEWSIVENRADVKKLAALVIDWMRLVVENDSETAKNWHCPSLVAAWDQGIDMISRNAPHIIAAHVPGKNNFIMPQLDCHLAITFLDLAAYSMGLGACWLGFLMFARPYRPIKEFLRIPEGREMYGAALLGYPKHRFLRVPGRKKPTITWI